MDTIPKIAIAIARQAAPDEIHQAPLIAANFVQGGRRRKELLQPATTGEPGGFGIGETSLLAWIFHALTQIAPILTGFLASKTIDNAGFIMKEIHSALNSSHQNQQHNGHPSPPHDQFYSEPKQLHQCVTALERALQKAGLPSEKIETTAYKVIEVLWEETPDALMFLHKLTEKK